MQFRTLLLPSHFDQLIPKDILRKGTLLWIYFTYHLYCRKLLNKFSDVSEAILPSEAWDCLPKKSIPKQRLLF
jgi:hypothetical protein